MNVIQQQAVATPTPTTIATPFPTENLQIASVYHDPHDATRCRVLTMRRYPRGVPVRRPDGTLSFNIWVPAAAPSSNLLDTLRMRLRVAQPIEHDMIRAGFMVNYIHEVRKRLVDEIVVYTAKATGRGWERKVEEVKPHEGGTRETVLDWLLRQAQDMRLTLLCHEQAPADAVDEARGLYCHRAALLKLLQAPSIDSMIWHYTSIEEDERAKIAAR